MGGDPPPFAKFVFSIGTLHYMKKNACSGRPFLPKKHVRALSNEWDQSNDQRGLIVDIME